MANLESLVELLFEKDWVLVEPVRFEHSRLLDGALEWTVECTVTNRRLQLRFQAFGPLGQRTKSLRDIFFVEAEGALNACLYFSKVSGKEWADGAREFVASLDAYRYPSGEHRHDQKRS